MRTVQVKKKLVKIRNFQKRKQRKFLIQERKKQRKKGKKERKQKKKNLMIRKEK